MCQETRLKPTSVKTTRDADQIVPTFRHEERTTSKQVSDVADLTSSDLAMLKRDDPFMYYSIPEVRSAALTGGDVNAAVAGIAPSREFYFSERTTKGPRNERQVKRQTRISAEFHPGLLLDELYRGFDLTCPSLESGDDDFFDFLLSLGETTQPSVCY